MVYYLRRLTGRRRGVVHPRRTCGIWVGSLRPHYQTL